MIFFEDDREAVGKRGDFVLQLGRTDGRGDRRDGHGARASRDSDG
jgi:hypothetical protein